MKGLVLPFPPLNFNRNFQKNEKRHRNARCKKCDAGRVEGKEYFEPGRMESLPD